MDAATVGEGRLDLKVQRQILCFDSDKGTLRVYYTFSFSLILCSQQKYSGRRGGF